jgi:aspartate/methionine/tyrosine aminotransferase
MEFKPFKHLAYLTGLRKRLSKPLQYNLSDSCCESLSFAQLLAFDKTNTLDQLDLGYATIPGSPALRQAIATIHQRVLPNPQVIDADNVAVFCGAQEALFATFNALNSQTESTASEAIILTPCYPSILAVPEQLGVTVKAVELSFDNQWQFTIDDIKARLSNNTRFIVLNSPHNPTGAVMPRELAQEIVTLAREQGIYLISDEVSVLSTHQESDKVELDIHHPLLAYEKTIAIGVMSKSFGLGGVRIGWAVTQDKALLQRLLDIKGYTSICSSATDEHLATIAINNHQQIIKRNNHIIKTNLAAFSQFIETNGNRFEWHPPKGGILTLVKSNLVIDIHQLAEKLAVEHQVLILPGDLFDIEGNYFRLGLGQSNFVEGLQRFQALVDCLEG